MSNSGRLLPFLALSVAYYKVSPHSVVIPVPPYLVLFVRYVDT